MAIQIGNKKYLSYEEQVLKNKENITENSTAILSNTSLINGLKEDVNKNTEDINEIKSEISGLTIDSVKVALVTSSFSTTGVILQALVIDGTDIFPAYVCEDTVDVWGLEDSAASTTATCTITKTNVECSGCSAVVYYQE